MVISKLKFGHTATKVFLFRYFVDACVILACTIVGVVLCHLLLALVSDFHNSIQGQSQGMFQSRSTIHVSG